MRTVEKISSTVRLRVNRWPISARTHTNSFFPVTSAPLHIRRKFNAYFSAVNFFLNHTCTYVCGLKNRIIMHGWMNLESLQAGCRGRRLKHPNNRINHNNTVESERERVRERESERDQYTTTIAQLSLPAGGSTNRIQITPQTPNTIISKYNHDHTVVLYIYFKKKI
jgi:hypothetical protein